MSEARRGLECGVVDTETDSRYSNAMHHRQRRPHQTD